MNATMLLHKLKKTIFISIFIILVIIVFCIIFNNRKKGLLKTFSVTVDDKKEILQEIFPNSLIELYKKKDKVYYTIIGDSKAEFNVIDGTLVQEKKVTLDILPIDINHDGKEELVALVHITFIGAVAEAFQNCFYISIFEQENDKYMLLTEQRVVKPDELGLFYDLTLENAELIDLNKDGVNEIMIAYKADAYLGLDAKKVTIFEWRENKFYPIWRETLHLDTSNYSRRHDSVKIYDANFQFIPSDNSYSKIKVEKTISKEDDVIFTSPEIEIKEYIWNEKELQYYLFF